MNGINHSTMRSPPMNGVPTWDPLGLGDMLSGMKSRLATGGLWKKSTIKLGENETLAT